MIKSDIKTIGETLRDSYDWLNMIYKETDDSGDLEIILNKPNLKISLDKIETAIDILISQP